MANEDFSQIDFSQYGTWETITFRGQTLYRIPGSGYVYDPFLTAQRGKPTVRPDPQPLIDAENEQKKNSDAARQAASPAGQLIPAVGAAGATALGTYLASLAKGSVAAPVAQTTTTAAAAAPAAQGAASGGASGSSAGGGLATNTGASASSTAPATGYSSLGYGAQAGVAAGVAGGTYLLYKGMNDMLAGRDTKSPTDWAARAQTAWTTGGLSEVGRAVGFGSGKDKDQFQRDSIRGILAETGFTDENHNIELADGTKFNIGLDGKTKAYNVDGTNEFSRQAAAWANPLAILLTRGDKKLTDDFTGYLANGVMSNAKSIEDVRTNGLALLSKLGLDPGGASAALSALLQEKKITQDQYNGAVWQIGSLAKGDPSIYFQGSLANDPAWKGNSGKKPGVAPLPNATNLGSAAAGNFANQQARPLPNTNARVPTANQQVRPLPINSAPKGVAGAATKSFLRGL